MVIKGLVFTFQWATTLSSLNIKGDPTELRVEAIRLRTNFKVCNIKTMINTLKQDE